jgi:hypothetical protein
MVLNLMKNRICCLLFKINFCVLNNSWVMRF